mgnify:CR=1 FL=1
MYNDKQKNSVIYTGSASNSGLISNSVDYIFTDPPFGSNLMYSELNFQWESWLKVLTDSTVEAIENKCASFEKINEKPKLIVIENSHDHMERPY